MNEGSAKSRLKTAGLKTKLAAAFETKPSKSEQAQLQQQQQQQQQQLLEQVGELEARII